MKPRSWRRRLLKDGIILLSGRHILSKDYTNEPTGTPYLTGPSDFPDGQILVTKYTNKPEVICEQSDILLTVKGSGTGKIIKADREYCISRQLMAIQVKNKKWDSDFVYYYLEHNNTRYEDAAAGLIPGITREDVLQTPIMLPPLPEQRRITEILGAWDAAIELVEQRLAAAEQRKRALMQRLLTGRARFPEFVQSRELRKTKIGTYPKEWRIRHLSDVAEIQVSYVDKKSKPSEQPVRLCNYMDVFNNDYIYDQMDFMEASATESEIQKCMLKKQDVIITKDSETREEIAESCVVVENLTNVVCGYHLTILRPKKNIISGFFLKDVLSCPSVHHQFVKLANGTTRFGLTISATHKALIPVPSVEEQEKIAAVLQSCDREIELLERKRDALQRQKKGLMQRLLTGRVRV